MAAEYRTILIAVAIAIAPTMAVASGSGPRVPCPSAEHLPLLTIDDVKDPAVPVVDRWQVTFQGVPLSDAQIAQMARNDSMIERSREEMKRRGTWVYIGIATAAAGTALSSIGWVLFGKETKGVPEELALSMAIGGIAIGGAGTLLTVESIQTPLEPHIAPTPRHRLTREEMRQLVGTINDRLYAGICASVERAEADRQKRAEELEALRRGEANPTELFLPAEEPQPDTEEKPADSDEPASPSAS